MITFDLRKHIQGDYKSKVEKLKAKGKTFYLREGTECCEIILDDTCYVYTNKSRFPANKLFLFKMVRHDADEFLQAHSNIVLPKERHVAFYNYDYDDSYGTIVGTDLNHAYWRIAYNLGIISAKTYNKGLGQECKALRLATLSTLGREKSYTYYEKGTSVNVIKQKEKDEDASTLYKLIRFTCYTMMREAADCLGDDFDCWKTDCIYYRDSEQNREKVNSYFQSQGMDFKILEFA